MQFRNAWCSKRSFAPIGCQPDDEQLFGSLEECNIMIRHPLDSSSKSAIHVCQTELKFDQGKHLRSRAAQEMRWSSVRGMGVMQ